MEALPGRPAWSPRLRPYWSPPCASSALRARSTAHAGSSSAARSEHQLQWSEVAWSESIRRRRFAASKFELRRSRCLTSTSVRDFRRSWTGSSRSMSRATTRRRRQAERAATVSILYFFFFKWFPERLDCRRSFCGSETVVRVTVYNEAGVFFYGVATPALWCSFTVYVWCSVITWNEWRF